MTEDSEPPSDVETEPRYGGQGLERTRWATLLLPAFSAAFVVVAVFSFLKVFAVLGVLSPWLRAIAGLLLPAALFVVLGHGVGMRAAASTPADRNPAMLAGLIAIYAGIAAGVIFWALGVEELILKRFGVYPLYEEHSLFPIEVVVYWVVATVPILAGFGLARVRLRRGDPRALRENG